MGIILERLVVFYEKDFIAAIMAALYEKYLERPYMRPLQGEELREFVSAYGFCLDMINRKRREFDAVVTEMLAGIKQEEV